MPLLKELLRAVASLTECGGERRVQISGPLLCLNMYVLQMYMLPITGACECRGMPADTAPQRSLLRRPRSSACENRGMLGGQP